MKFLRRFLPIIASLSLAFMPLSCIAEWKIVDALDVSPLIPTVLDAFMAIATGGYEFFVGHGDGIIYMLVWGILAISMAGYLLKMYFPKSWLDFFGFASSDTIGSVDEIKMTQNILKPAVRAIIAVTILLQIKPIFVTDWLVNPFLRFGSLYTEALVKAIPQTGINPPHIECPPDIVEKGWTSKDSCEFLVQPVATLSHANNQIVKRGFKFITDGLRGLLSLMLHNAGENFLNVITGIILVTTFVSCNIFMALLIIQAIFNFGMALILYPFQILVWVAKKDDKWVNIWPAISGITKALLDLIVTMIACGFILGINVSIVHSLFNWNQSVFSVAAGGMATSNVPMASSSSVGFGGHSVIWLSSVLTFFVMLRIFQLTKDKISQYTQSDMTGLYNSVKSDAGIMWNKAKALPKKVSEIAGWVKK